jgi:hypothetical protein
MIRKIIFNIKMNLDIYLIRTCLIFIILSCIFYLFK